MATISTAFINKGFGLLQDYLKQNWSLIFNSAAGIVMRLLPAIGGFVYQALVTRNYDQVTVGLINAFTLNLSTLGTFSMVGIGSYLVSKLHDKRFDRASLITSGLITGALTGFIFGALFAVLAPFGISALKPMHANPLYIVIFALGSGIATFILTFEEILVGLLMGGMSMLRSAGFAIFRVALLWVFISVLGPITPFFPIIAWIAADATSTVILLVYGVARNKLPRFGKLDLAVIRTGISEALQHHVLNMALNISGWFVPMIVGAVLTAEKFASFSVAWQNTGFAFTIPFALAGVLFAAGVKEPFAANARLKQLMVIGIIASLGAIVVFWFALPFLMRTLGPNYVDEGTLAARLIVLALIPVMIKGMWVTIERIHGRMKNATKILAIGGVIELGFPAIGGVVAGVGGACAGWLLSQILLGIYFAVPLYRAARLRSGQRPLSRATG